MPRSAAVGSSSDSLIVRFCGARSVDKAELERRAGLFHRQEWILLLEEARHMSSGLRRKTTQLTAEEEEVRRARQAEKIVHQGEVSRARQALCSQARAPGTTATLNELRDPERPPPPIVGGHPTRGQWLLAPAPISVGPGEVRMQPPQCTQRFSSRGGRRHQRTFEGVVGRQSGNFVGHGGG